MIPRGVDFVRVILACLVLVGLGHTHAMAQGAPGAGPFGPSAGACDLNAVARAKTEFQRLPAIRRSAPAAVSIEDLRVASVAYLVQADACYEAHGPAGTIDEGGLTLNPVPGSAQFGLDGRKWGVGSPFASVGVDANGPRLAGGTVTYSFMGNGIGGFEIEGGTPGVSVAISSLPTFAPCFIEEVTNAFALWSAVSNIQFVRVADNSVPFNAIGATGDIRIGAHVIDGPSGVLAHGYYPPPNGGSAAGDIHFDVSENWTCSGIGGFDFGIIAAHEVGHAIGLNHEFRAGPQRRAALMNPNYNALIAFPLGDDINGAENLYGSAIGNSPDAIIHFQDGVLVFDYAVGWTELSTSGADQIVTGDLDGNGVDEVIVDFGSDYGVWVRLNDEQWFQLHQQSPTFMAVGDVDDSGRDDLVADFEGYGVWQWMNNGWWTQLSPSSATVFAIGNLDNLSGDDVVLTFPGSGVWRWTNNAFWVQVHAADADQLVVGDFDDTPLALAANPDDLALNFPGLGLYVSRNQSTPFELSASPAAHLAAGDVNGDGRDELIIDLGSGQGIWVADILSTLVRLHPVDSEGLIVGDLDGNGQGDILVDFGEQYGIWVYVNNSSWMHLTPRSPEGMAIADLD